MIAVIKYNAGNIASVENAIRKLGYEVIVTDNATEIKSADKVIFPGVGEASSAMKYVKLKGIDEVIISLTQPVLGICLGMQLLCLSSEEGHTKGLGIFNTHVKKFPSTDKIPHMGWNTLYQTQSNLFNDISPNSDCYFVHSYYAEPCDNTVALTDYIVPFSAALQSKNFYGTQFHPEKSAGVGSIILNNFLQL
jgi:glutamine amidotransferase